MFGLFSFVFDAIDSVVGQITNFGSQIEDEIFGVISGFVQQVQGGIWRGNGADAFVQEMSDVVLPEVRNLIASLTGGGGLIPGINQVTNMISELDDFMGGVANAIGDVFDAIF